MEIKPVVEACFFSQLFWLRFCDRCSQIWFILEYTSLSMYWFVTIICLCSVYLKMKFKNSLRSVHIVNGWHHSAGSLTWSEVSITFQRALHMGRKEKWGLTYPPHLYWGQWCLPVQLQHFSHLRTIFYFLQRLGVSPGAYLFYATCQCCKHLQNRFTV